MAETVREIVARMWAMGFSQTVIAAKIGKTRSAVGGLLNRMKLHGRRATKPGRPRKVFPGAWPGHGAVAKLRPAPVVILSSRPLPVFESIVVHSMPPIPITELGPLSRFDDEADHCRYIVEGEVASALYCGAPRSREADVQYCDEHAARCFNNWPPTGRPYRPKDQTMREFR